MGDCEVENGKRKTILIAWEEMLRNVVEEWYSEIFACSTKLVQQGYAGKTGLATNPVPREPLCQITESEILPKRKFSGHCSLFQCFRDIASYYAWSQAPKARNYLASGQWNPNPYLVGPQDPIRTITPSDHQARLMQTTLGFRTHGYRRKRLEL